MKITIAIDFGNKETIAVNERHFEDYPSDHLPPSFVGEVIGKTISGYLREKYNWQRADELAQLLLMKHDMEKSYKGAAPAGDYNKAWGFREVKQHICIPVCDRPV